MNEFGKPAGSSGRGGFAEVAAGPLAPRGGHSMAPSEADFRALADSVNLFCWIADGDGWIFWYNRRWHDFTGTTAAEMEGWGWRSVHDPVLLPAVMEKWQASIRTGEPFEMVFPLRRADGRFRTFLTRAQPSKDAGGRVVRWFGTNTDISPIEINEARLRRLLDNISGYVGVLELDGTLIEANAAPVEFAGLRREDVIGRKLWETDWWSGSAAAQAQLRDACARARDGETVRYDTEMTVLAGARITIDLQIAPLWNFDGAAEATGDALDLPPRITHLIASGFDVTDREQAQAQALFLMQESSHRSKNLLTVVQALAKQTVRRAESMAAFEERFMQRLEGLAASLDLLVGQAWQGADLAELVARQLAPFVEAGPRLEIAGPTVKVAAEAAQSIGLAMHELATNAAKYGALSNEAGRVSVQWRFDYGGDGVRRMAMLWRESGGPPVLPPSRHGFGQVVVERMVAFALKGEVRLDFLPGGLTWSLSMPASQLGGDRAA